MAKSVRASVSKRNRANLRKKVFGPVDNARTERLAAKLQELASQPRPKALEKPNTDITANGTEEQDETGAAKATQSSEEMDIDAHTTKSTTSRSHKSGRVQKRNRRTRPSIVFQSRSSKAKKGSKKK